MSEFKERLPAELVQQYLGYDPSTGQLTWRRRPGVEWWNTRHAGTIAGTRKRGEIQVSITHNGRARLYRAHTLVWALVTGTWPEREIDHRNGDPYDNSWDNLRLQSTEQCRSNSHVPVGEIAFKGVYFHRVRGRFAAQIKANKVWKWLGLHSTAEAAARAYDAAAERMLGEFAVTNRSLGLLSDHA